jgi:hypothetical protein
MPYSTREAMTVALFNAGVEPLHDAFDLADQVIKGLSGMGFYVVDVNHTDDLEAARAAIQSGHPSALPPRLAHLKAVEDVQSEQ